MALDTSIYRNIKSFEAPSMMDSMQKAQSLKHIGMQNQAAEQEMAAKQRAQKMTAIGSALEGMAKLPESQRGQAYAQVQEGLIKSGILSPDEAEDYEPNKFQQSLMGWRMSPEAKAFQKQSLEMDHLKAQNAKLYADAKRKDTGMDPMQFFVAKEQYKEAEDQRKKTEELTTNYGIARTPDDAKKLKDAGEIKEKFDRMMTELIGLRENYGGEMMNREAVGRAKQLSNDLLLAYKDLSKLGVLSQSDEKILNSIIPKDPLAFSPMPGQDPIMHQLKKFRDDSEADFKTRIANRVRGGAPAAQSRPGVDVPQGGGSGFGPYSAHAAPAPKHGDVQDGYVFMGGDPADQKNWKRR
jgi:hypothetical protein